MALRNRAAFTLVELLVVITIIAMLVGLMLPAVLAARNRAQVTKCAANQGQLGKAMLGYALAKKHFPGYANTLKNVKVSWAPLLLPYIERNDLWEGTSGWRSGNRSAAAKIPTFICPSDTTLDNGLSYVVNVGQTKNSTTGMFRDFFNVASPDYVSTTDIKSTSQHPMIAEKSAEAVSPGREWTNTAGAVTAVRFGFIWPPPPDGDAMIVNPNANASLGYLVPIHNGLINVTFCDGHTEGLTDDPETIYNKYDVNDPS